MPLPSYLWRHKLGILYLLRATQTCLSRISVKHFTRGGYGWLRMGRCWALKVIWLPVLIQHRGGWRQKKKKGAHKGGSWPWHTIGAAAFYLPFSSPRPSPFVCIFKCRINAPGRLGSARGWHPQENNKKKRETCLKQDISMCDGIRVVVVGGWVILEGSKMYSVFYFFAFKKKNLT